MKDLKDSLKKAYQRSILSSICFIILGLFLVFESQLTLAVISYIIGGVLIAMGLAAFIRYFQTKSDARAFTFDLVYGIMTILVGVVIILNPQTLASFIPFILGFFIVVSGAFKFQNAFSLRSMKSDMWVGTLIVAIMMVICGLVLLFNPFAGAVALTKIIGIFMVIYALLDVVTAWMLKKETKRNVKEVHKILNDD